MLRSRRFDDAVSSYERALALQRNGGGRMSPRSLANPTSTAAPRCRSWASRFDGCWRWLLSRSDSPWYPSVRLFRQRAPGTWDEVVRQVRDELFRLVA